VPIGCLLMHSVTFSEKDLTMKISQGISIPILLALYYSSSKLRNYMYFFLHESDFLMKASDPRNKQVLILSINVSIAWQKIYFIFLYFLKFGHMKWDYDKIILTNYELRGSVYITDMTY